MKGGLQGGVDYQGGEIRRVHLLDPLHQHVAEAIIGEVLADLSHLPVGNIVKPGLGLPLGESPGLPWGSGR